MVMVADISRKAATGVTLNVTFLCHLQACLSRQARFTHNLVLTTLEPLCYTIKGTFGRDQVRGEGWWIWQEMPLQRRVNHQPQSILYHPIGVAFLS